MPNKRGHHRRGLTVMLIGVAMSVVSVVPANAAPKNPPSPPPPRSQRVPDSLLTNSSLANSRPTTPDDCGAVRARMSEVAKAGADRTICVESIGPVGGKLPGAGGSRGGGVEAFAPYPNPTSLCTSTNEWRYNRLAFCLAAYNVVINTIRTDNGQVIGTATWTIIHSSGLDAYSTTWNNPSSWTVTAKTGQAADILQKADSRCSGCTGANYNNPVFGPIVMGLNQQVNGQNTLSDNTAPGAINPNIDVYWQDFITCSGCVSSAILNYQFPLKVRCDAVSGVNGSAGCVVPSFTPEAQFTGYSTGNTSTAFFNFMQYWGNDHWGRYPSGTPMTRLADQTQAAANRAAMCAGFQYLFSGDSCDEFPFASSYQSGNMLGLSPGDCSNIYPVYGGGTSWTFYDEGGNWSTSQRCGLGHAVGSDNSINGLVYARLIQSQRLLDQDRFWVGLYN